MLSRRLIFLIVTIVGILGLLTVGLLFFTNKRVPNQPNSTNTTTIVPSGEQPPIGVATIPLFPTITHQTGLHINRDTLIGAFTKLDPTNIKFTSAGQIGGQDNYITQDGQNTIQLIGPTNNLSSISTVADMYPPESSDEYIIKVANLVDPTSNAWAIKSVQDISKDLKTSVVTRTTTINGKQFQLVGEPDFYAITLTIQPAN